MYRERSSYTEKLGSDLYRLDGGQHSVVAHPVALLTPDVAEVALNNGLVYGFAGVRRKVNRCLEVETDFPVAAVLGPNRGLVKGFIAENSDGLVVLPNHKKPGMIRGLAREQIAFLLDHGVVSRFFLDGPAGVLNQVYADEVMREAPEMKDLKAYADELREELERVVSGL